MAFKKIISTKKNHARDINIRFIIVIVAIVLIIVLLAYRLVFINTADKKFMDEKANRQLIHTTIISTTRGDILDRNHIPLAVSTTLYNAILDVKIFKKNTSNITLLSNLNINSIPKRKIIDIINCHPHSRYQILAKYITPSDAEKISISRIPGVHLEKKMRTFYPQANSIAALVGYTNSLNQGQSGLELSFNHELNSKDGVKSVATDPKGNIIKELKIIKAYKLFTSRLSLSFKGRIVKTAIKQKCI